MDIVQFTLLVYAFQRCPPQALGLVSRGLEAWAALGVRIRDVIRRRSGGILQDGILVTGAAIGENNSTSVR